ncbi:MAG: hypothetical protein PUP91_24825 [Rhizonema sp. PD37]|nr:hypothetical protein [Rhizonema sp. PD37]
MIPRLSTAWLVPLALTIVSFGSSAARATAHKIYQFTGHYSTTVIITPITDNVSQVVESGESLDAPYGLNQYNGLTYSQTDSSGNTSFNNDAAKLEFKLKVARIEPQMYIQRDINIVLPDF